jgi:O-antigen ligase
MVRREVALLRHRPMNVGAANAAARSGGGSVDLRERRALAWARGAAGTALIGAFVLPTLANLATFALLLSLVFLPSARERLRAVLATRLARAALLLLAVLALATLWAEVPALERFRAWWDWRVLLLLIFGLAIFDDAPARRRVLLAFIAVAVLGAAYSFWAWAHGYSAVSNNHSMTGIVLRNPVSQGMAFALACFFAAMLALTERALDRRLRAALAGAAAFLLANLVFVTSGRSAHLLLLILLAATALQLLRGRQRIAAVVLLSLAAVLAYSASPMLQNRFGLLVREMRAPLASEQLSAMGIRSVMWNVSVQMAAERPLLGYGMGSVLIAYQRKLAESSYTGWAKTPVTDPHNQYLQVQLQAGIAGTAAFLWFLLAAFRHPASPPRRAWATAILLGWCATSMATSHFTTFAEGHLLMLSLGLLLAADRKEPSGQA